jgi:predicted RNase H-like HicB family nuclease
MAGWWMMKTLKLPVIIKLGEDGYFVAEIPVLPGCFSQGKTKEEALANIKEAAQLCLECQKEEGWTIPEKYIVEQVEVGIS